MKKKTENSELENISNKEPAVGTVAQTSAEIVSTSSDGEQSGEDLEEELEEDPEEEENDESEVDLEEDSEEEQEDAEVEPENDPDAKPSVEDSDEDPSEVDPDEDPSEEDPEEYVSHLDSKSEYDSEDKQRPIDATMELSSSQVFKSKERCSRWEIGESASDKKEPPGKSGKQRRSRWEPLLEQDKKSSVVDMNTKRRKTRWDVVADNLFDSKGHQQALRLTEIDSILQASKLRSLRFRHDVRVRKKLIKERDGIVAELRKNKETPTANEPEKLCKKLYIPVKEYPTYNFMGLILGPQGNTIKKMETETGAKILLRGKGSVKKQADASDDEDLHVQIISNSQKSVDAAVAMVEKLLVPIDDHVNKHKLAQLKELAKLRGNYENTCRVCWEQGHETYACPQRPSTLNESFLKITNPPNLMLDSVQKPMKEIDDSTLYIGYLPKIVDDNRLREMFSPFGKIVKAIVMKNKASGVSKGYGFVKFNNATDAATAEIYMNNHKMDGHVLAVRVAGTEPPVAVLPPLAPLPPYPAYTSAPAPPYPGGMSQSQADWPGQPSSTYYGHVNQYRSSGSTYITPSFMSGLRESKAEPDPLARFPGDPDYPGSDLLARFPGDPDYRGSNFKSYFSTRTL